MEARLRISQLPKINFNEIQLGKQLVEGTQGKIQLVTWKNTQYALKEFNKKKYFTSELDILTLLHNLQAPNIVSIYGSLTYPHNTFLMEYFPNGDLFEFNEKHGPFSWKILFPIFTDITLGMLFLHRNKIMHCDIKAENVLLTNDMHAKLSDFGLAVNCNKKIPPTPCGSVEMMAPEVMRGEIYTYKADIYSFAYLMFEVGANVALFNDEDSWNKVLLEKESGLKNKKFPPEFPKGVAYLVKWCWNPQPTYRPKTQGVLTMLQEASKNYVG